MEAETFGGAMGEIATFLGVIGALGTAAFGLVDATKFFRGGMSNAGFAFVEKALRPFNAALSVAVGETTEWRDVVKAHWLNGRAKDEQKAIAKSLIRLGLSPDNAASLAVAGRVDGVALGGAAKSLDTGATLSETQINVLGRFDAAIDALMDAAFERADQYYRNSSKALAACVSVILAIVGGGILYKSSPTGFDLTAYLASPDFLTALLVGLVAVPVAPISKDMISALGTAVRALQAVKGPRP